MMLRRYHPSTEAVLASVEGDAATTAGNPVSLTKTNTEPALSDHTVAELKALAATRGIDLGKAKNKPEIVALIEAATA